MDLEQGSIELIKMAAKMAMNYYGQPIVCTYSGGKDSDVLLELFLRSGVDFEVHNSHTTADAPETVYHIRKKFKQLEEKGIKCTIQYPKMSMWTLIPHKKMPPTRLARYCCAYLKETALPNRMIATGVRWDESNARKERGSMEILTPKKKDRIVLQRSDFIEEAEEYEQLSIFEDKRETMLMNDNNKKRRFFERCQLKAKSVCNPMVNWTTKELYDYIGAEHIEINPLYGCGFCRVGCIGCPMADKQRWFEFSVFPKYRDNYIRAFDRMVQVLKVERLASEKVLTPLKWKNGLDVFDWWMDNQTIEGQIELTEWLEEAGIYTGNEF